MGNRLRPLSAARQNSNWKHPEQQRYYFGFRQMGIPLVCLMGPGIPYDRICLYRSAVCQTTTDSAQQGMVYTPNGQIPAYEWSFSDVNPPVQAWAAMRVYEIERKKTGRW